MQCWSGSRAGHNRAKLAGGGLQVSANRSIIKRRTVTGHSAAEGRDAMSQSVVMDAVKAYATLGEICDVWRDLYSVWADPIAG